MPLSQNASPSASSQKVNSGLAIPGRISPLETILRSLVGAVGNAGAAYAGGQRDGLIVPMLGGAGASAFGARDYNRSIDSQVAAQQRVDMQNDAIYAKLGINGLKPGTPYDTATVNDINSRLHREALGGVNKSLGAPTAQANPDLPKDFLEGRLDKKEQYQRDFLSSGAIIPAIRQGMRTINRPLNAGGMPPTGTQVYAAPNQIKPDTQASTAKLYSKLAPDDMDRQGAFFQRASDAGQLNATLTALAEKAGIDPERLINSYAHAGKTPMPPTGSPQSPMTGGVSQSPPDPNFWMGPEVGDPKITQASVNTGVEAGTTQRNQDTNSLNNADNNVNRVQTTEMREEGATARNAATNATSASNNAATNAASIERAKIISRAGMPGYTPMQAKLIDAVSKGMLLDPQILSANNLDPNTLLPISASGPPASIPNISFTPYARPRQFAPYSLDSMLNRPVTIPTYPDTGFLDPNRIPD